MDIRNFFSVVKKGSDSSINTNNDKTSTKVNRSNNKKHKRVIDSDDESPCPPKKKPTPAHLSDSEDDVFQDRRKKTPKSEEKKSTSKSNKLKKNEETTVKLKECSAASFFSSSPALKKEKVQNHKKNEESIVKHKNLPEKREPKESPSKRVSKFEKTLEQLDEKHTNVSSKKQTPSKSKSVKTELVISPNKPNENSPPKKEEKSTRRTPKKEEKSTTRTPKKEEKNSRRTPKKEENKSKVTPRKNEDKSVERKEISSPPSKRIKLNDKKISKKNSSLNIEIEKNDKNNSNSKGSKSDQKISPNKKAIIKAVEDEEMEEYLKKKKQAAANYRNYLQKVNAGAKNPGSKIIPDGKPECLAGLTFVLSGIFDSLDRTEMGELIQKYGGKVTTGVSGKTNYLVLGDDGGQSKIAKAEKFGTKVISEDDLLDQIKNRPGKSIDKKNTSISDEKKKNYSTTSSSIEEKTIMSSTKKDSGSKDKRNFKKENSLSESKKESVKSFSSQDSKSSTQPLNTQELSSRVSGELMWVDKYKPATLKNIIGQQGDKSNAKKLLSWVKNWVNNQSGKKKLVRPSPWAKDHDGSFFKAALLSGPPGVGKTTTAQLVCKEMGYDTVELNASDTRSKKSLTEVVSQLLTNTSLSDYASNTAAKSTTTRNHVLLMDEVDGMAGNEDRGGVQELIQLIKSSKVPIICMCNDRQHPKIRSLANYCFDLRFYKPRIEQIRGAMMSVCFREGIKLKPDALDQIIIGSNQDVRQVLHHLSIFSANDDRLDSNKVKQDASKVKKDLKIGPWDVCRQVFNDSDRKNMTIHQKADLFFHDYSIGPLFVQENYWKARPKCAQGGQKSAVLKQVALAANSIADGDLVERAIRTNNSWSLLPTQAMFSCVMPGDFMSGHLGGEIEFPSWLGQNSKKNKMDRLSQELHMHTRLKTSGNKTDMALEYCRSLRDNIVKPLLTDGSDGVSSAVNAMTDYCLLREDLDSLVEMTTWSTKPDIFSKVESKVKAAFTRSLNKNAALTPYSVVTAPKKKRGKSSNEEEAYGEEEEEESEEEMEDVSNDAMIKVKKVTSSSKGKDKKKDVGSSSKASKKK